MRRGYLYILRETRAASQGTLGRKKTRPKLRRASAQWEAHSRRAREQGIKYL
jgi:hypothetical protein